MPAKFVVACWLRPAWFNGSSMSAGAGADRPACDSRSSSGYPKTLSTYSNSSRVPFLSSIFSTNSFRDQLFWGQNFLPIFSQTNFFEVNFFCQFFGHKVFFDQFFACNAFWFLAKFFVSFCKLIFYDQISSGSTFFIQSFGDNFLLWQIFFVTTQFWWKSTNLSTKLP